MIIRRPDARTIVFLDDDGETERARFVLPEGGCTTEELMRFGEHLVREARRSEAGSS